MDQSSIRSSYEYFLKHRTKLHDEYGDKFLVIIDSNVIEAYDDQATAYTETTKNHEPGTFIIQQASEGGSSAQQVFHSRVLKA